MSFGKINVQLGVFVVYCIIYACPHHYNYHHHRVKICLKGLSSACSGLLIIVENTNQPTTLQPVISSDGKTRVLKENRCLQ